MKNKETVFITGAAGYVGAMLIDVWSEREDVKEIIALDKSPMPKLLEGKKNVTWIVSNTADDWEARVREHQPSIVVHAAWQIRNLYGKKKEQWRWNVCGSRRVFRFATTTPSVKRLIHFSSASIYGAYPDNEIEHRFTEDAPLRSEVYLYAIEKQQAERELTHALSEAPHTPQVAVVRPAAISGPRGRFMMHERFGLQSALSGNLKGGWLYRLVTLLTSFVPATKKWCRQFVHEDDVVRILTELAFGDQKYTYEYFNLAPPGAVVRPGDMARAVGKRVVLIPPQLIRLVFYFLYNVTFGKIPTAPGAWRFYSYPIVMDGEKVTKDLGINYTYSSLESFTTPRGRYSYAVPKERIAL